MKNLSTDGGSGTEHQLTIVGNNADADYIIDVTGTYTGAMRGGNPEATTGPGKIEWQESYGDKQDSFEGSRATGHAGPHTDTYHFTGEIDKIRLQSRSDKDASDLVRVYIDGQAIDLSQYDVEKVSKSTFADLLAGENGLLSSVPGILPGIGPLSSSETTAAAILPAFAIAGWRLK